MKFFLMLIFLSLIFFSSCKRNVHVNDSAVKTDGIDSVKTTAPSPASDKKIETKVYKNTSLPGFGYDIIINGITSVHQPNIPAVPGNIGFSTEKKAHKTADFVASKIRNNIFPPSVDIKELDSLGVLK
jgi:hypothetical protein